MSSEVSVYDLAVYLDLSEINEERAELLLAQATILAESIVSPLPASASAVVLAVAGRAYSNPQGVSSETVGSYSVQRPQAGLYLTRDDRRTLQRLAGRGGAFTVDPTPADVAPEVTWPVVLAPDELRNVWTDVNGEWVP